MQRKRIRNDSQKYSLSYLKVKCTLPKLEQTHIKSQANQWYSSPHYEMLVVLWKFRWKVRCWMKEWARACVWMEKKFQIVEVCEVRKSKYFVHKFGWTISIKNFYMEVNMDCSFRCAPITIFYYWTGVNKVERQKSN